MQFTKPYNRQTRIFFHLDVTDDKMTCPEKNKRDTYFTDDVMHRKRPGQASGLPHPNL
jgi:hypothetical protein